MRPRVGENVADENGTRECECCGGWVRRKEAKESMATMKR